ncbi:MAG TPA: CHAT domain-containing protein [Acidobacteriota bacterium]|nr:CHAT domain-containing protein [Acidobacteriota bacterium]
MMRLLSSLSVHSQRFRQCLRIGLTLALVLPILACASGSPESQRFATLAAEDTFQNALAGQQSHVYPVELGSGTYLHVRVQQQGIDVVLRLSDPQERILIEADSPTGAGGDEELHYLAQNKGTYQLAIIPFQASAPPGRYQGRVLALRPAQDRDHAVMAVDQAKRVRQSGGDESEREALQHYGRALKIWQDLGDLEEASAVVWEMGRMALDLGDAEQSVKWLRQALDGYQQVGDRSRQAQVHNDLGRAFQSRAQPEKSFEHHQKALETARLASDPYQQAVSQVFIARRLSSGGRIEEALETFEAAISQFRSMEESSRLADTLTQAGRCYSLLGRMEESQERLQEALKIREAEGNIRRQVTVLTEIGWNHYLLRETSQAIKILEQAVALTQEAGRRGPAGTLDRLGSAYRQAGLYRRSRQSYQQALSLLGDADSLWKANTWANLGELYQQWDQPEVALQHLNRAIPHFRENRDVHALAHALYVSAQALRDQGQLAEARRRLEEMLSILESVRFQLDRQAFLDALQTVYFAYYQAYVDLLMDLHERHPRQGYDLQAFAASERTRAFRLEQSWNAPPMASAQEARAEFERRRGWLQARVQAKDQERLRLTERGASQEEIAALDQEQNRLLLQLDALETEEPSPPKSTAEPLELDQVQSRLGQDTLLLYYALGAARSYLWRVDADSVRTYVLPPAAQIEQVTRRCQELLNLPPKPDRDVQVSLYLQRLGQALLDPVSGDLDGQRLIIVPDASIQYVPFAALGTPDRPLIVDHEVSYLPSATSLAFLEDRPTTGDTLSSLAVFADPVFSSRDSRLKEPAAEAETLTATAGNDLARSARDLGYARFDRLRYTRREADAISTLFPVEKRFEALDFQASRDQILAMDLSRFSIIHFATHGLLHPRYPQLSGIVLSLVDEQGHPLGGFLRSHDIARLRLNADLVVLSACRTAMGRQIPGEGVIGLPHSFMQAGVPAVVVSQWNVNDEATYRLMERYYRQMVVAGKSPPTALAEAQRWLRAQDEWKNPYYWAGFAHYGKTRYKTE